MEVSLNNLEGFPDDSIISVRVGTTRRQAKVAALEANNLKFPQSAELCETVAVDVHQVLASLRLVLVPHREQYHLQFDKADKKKMLCSMNVTRDAQAPEGKAAALKDAKTYKDAASSARQYLEDWQLLPYIQSLLHTVIEEKPENPYTFLQQQFSHSTKGRGEKVSPTCDVPNSPSSTVAPSVVGSATAAGSPLPAGAEDLQASSPCDEVDPFSALQQDVQAAREQSPRPGPETEEVRLYAKKMLEDAFEDGRFQQAVQQIVDNEQSTKPGINLTAKVELHKVQLRNALESCFLNGSLDQLFSEAAGPLLMHANALSEGEEGICRSTSRQGVVLERTTTDVLLQFDDGTKAWHEVENVGRSCALAAAYNLATGGTAAVLGQGGTQGIVHDRTTTDVQIQMSDGAKAWHAIEDVAQVLPTAYRVQEGDEVVRLSDAAKGTVKSRTTADVLLRMDDGQEAWHGLEDVAVDVRSFSQTAIRAALEGAQQSSSLGQILNDSTRPLLMSANGVEQGEPAICRTSSQRGIVLSRTTTDLLLEFDDGSQEWREVETVGQPVALAAAYNVSKGEVAAVLSKGGAQGIVLRRTTTDVNLQMHDDGTEAWYAVEDVAQVLPQAYNVQQGDEVVRLCDAAKGIVQSRTTTDVLLRMVDGTVEQYGLEDIAKAVVCSSGSVAKVDRMRLAVQAALQAAAENGSLDQVVAICASADGSNTRSSGGEIERMKATLRKGLEEAADSDKLVDYLHQSMESRMQADEEVEISADMHVRCGDVISDNSCPKTSGLRAPMATQVFSAEDLLDMSDDEDPAPAAQKEQNNQLAMFAAAAAALEEVAPDDAAIEEPTPPSEPPPPLPASGEQALELPWTSEALDAADFAAMQTLERKAQVTFLTDRFNSLEQDSSLLKQQVSSLESEMFQIRDNMRKIAQVLDSDA